MKTRTMLLMLLAASSGACGGGAGEDVTPAYTVTFTPLTIAPGVESTQCVHKRLNNPASIFVNGVNARLRGGSHHVIIYKSDVTDEQVEPFDCLPFGLAQDAGTPLTIAQQAEDEMRLPEGVGIAMGPQQMIRIEMHYINATAAPLEVSADISFDTVAAGALVAEAGFAFFADSAIQLAPQAETSNEPIFMELPQALDGAQFVSFTGHVHKLGTALRITAADSETATETVVYEPADFSWSEPPTVMHEPPITLPAGGGFRLSCTWNNTTDATVTFGDSANDEMCLFFTHYFPNNGTVSCGYTDLLDGGTYFCCPGDDLCDVLF